jgi:hypothetical protein
MVLWELEARRLEDASLKVRTHWIILVDSGLRTRLLHKISAHIQIVATANLLDASDGLKRR